MKMASRKGLSLYLHASLADKGLSRGTNSPVVSRWYDLSGNGNHGVLSGFNYTSESGWVGNNTLSDPYSLYFDGKEDYVTVVGNPSLKPSGSVSFEAWFYYVGGNVIMTTGARDGGQGVSISFNDLGELVLDVRTATKEASMNLGTKERLKLYHIVGVYDETTGFLSAFVNGAPNGRAMAKDATLTSPPTDLVIGRGTVVGTGWFRGAIPVVRLYSRALTMEEVGENYLDGYNLTDSKSERPSRIVVPHRKDLASTMKVGIGGRMQGKYRITPGGVSDTPAYIIVKKPVDIPGEMYVNPNGSLTASYRAIGVGQSEFEGSISVTKSKDLSGSVTVNPHTQLRARYRTEQLSISEVPSEISVKQGGVANGFYLNNLPSNIVVNTSGTVTARYRLEPLTVSDLPSSVEVKGSGNLPSNIRVASAGRVTARYRVLGITAADLESSLKITAVNQLKGSIGINTSGRLRAKYGTIVAGRSDLESSLIITSTFDVKSNIKIPVYGMLGVKYNVVAGGNADLPSNMMVKATEHLESSISVPPNTWAVVRYGIVGLYFADLESTLGIRETEDLPSTIAITPYTQMKVKYGMVQPPEYPATLYPVKDAFVREGVPRLNYGVESLMYAGKLNGERFRSFVGFDLAAAEIKKDNATIKSATMKLFFDGRSEPVRKIQVIEPYAHWTETGVTWNNQPFPFGYDSPTSAYEGINVVQEVGGDSHYIEIDVTQAIKDWHEGKREHYGFIIKAFDEDEIRVSNFMTKESRAYRPILDVVYYDKDVYSLGTSSIEGTITARQNKSSDRPGHMFIRSFQGKEELKGNIFVLNPRDLFSYITATKSSLVSEIAARQTDYSEIEGQIAVRTVGEPSELDGKILISKPDVPFSIYVLYRSDLPSSITARRKGEPPDVYGSITASRGSTVGHIGVRVKDKTDWASELTVNQASLIGSMRITEKSGIPGHIGVRGEGYDEIPIEGYLRYHDSIEGHVTIHKEWMEGHMEVFYSSMKPASITVRVKDDDDLPSELIILPRSDMPGHMYVPPKKDIPSSIFVLSGFLAGNIKVPHNNTSDRVSFITVRVRAVSDLESENGIRSGWLGSHVAVRIQKWKDLPSSISVKSADEDDLPGSIAVRVWDESDLEGNIKARKWRESDLHMSFKVRVWGEPSDHEGSITVRVWDESDHESEISVRTWGKADLPSDFKTRVKDASDLPSSIGANNHSNLDGHIAVRRDDSKDLPSYISVWMGHFTPGHIAVRRDDDSEIPGHLFIRAVSQLPSSIEVITAYPYAFIM